MATVAQMRKGLAATTMPDDVAASLLADASPLWLSSDTATQLAEDLALCHPPLNAAEVRARAVAVEEGWRLTVVAHDRKGLLADTAEILAQMNYSVRAASVATWAAFDIALHSMTLAGDAPDDAQLETLGMHLRAANVGKRPTFVFNPAGRAYVSKTGDANGDPMISVVAPDTRGLLAATCRWFTDAGVSIEAAWITGEEEANDVFVVSGDVDVLALEHRLSADHPPENIFEVARRVGEDFLRSLFRK